MYFAKENVKLQVLIAGHIGLANAEKKVKKLSENRAKAVYDFLISAGIDSGRITLQDLGSKQPISAVAAKSKKAMSLDMQNRRAEITILKIQS
jgi:outer membrane protein OmpA-like peptidoglycan-associated protein